MHPNVAGDKAYRLHMAHGSYVCKEVELVRVSAQLKMVLEPRW